jgi:sporulation protein YlmC with PRC-barrel domain
VTLNLVKTSDVIGMPLTGQEGRKLGTVRGIYLDLEAGSMEFLIVETAGLLGGSGKYHPVPSRIARYDSVDRSFQVNISRDSFRDSPSYDREQLSSANYAWAEQVGRFFAALRPADEA